MALKRFVQPPVGSHVCGLPTPPQAAQIYDTDASAMGIAPREPACEPSSAGDHPDRPGTTITTSGAATVTGGKDAIGRPTPDNVVGPALVLIAAWCRSVGTTWTLEVRQLDRDSALGTIVDWISSGVPVCQPAPDALAHALLAARGLRLIRVCCAGRRTRQRIGYLSTDAQPGQRDPVSLAPPTRQDSAPGRTTPGPPVRTKPDEYAHLIPRQRRYADLARDDPERQLLREELIKGYLPVAEHIAGRFVGRGEPLDDLIQIATLGLINAIDRFDPAHGYHFLSFAVPTITGEIRRYFRDHAWSTRVPRRLKDLHIAIKSTQTTLSQQLGRVPRPSEIADRLRLPVAEVIDGLQAGQAYRSSSLDEILCPAKPTATPDELIGHLDAELALVDDRETLRPLLSELAPRQQTILDLRFFHDLTQDQIAAQVGLSQMQVSRVLRQTLKFLQQRVSDGTDDTTTGTVNDGRGGKTHYLRRAVDQHEGCPDILGTSQRDAKAGHQVLPQAPDPVASTAV